MALDVAEVTQTVQEAMGPANPMSRAGRWPRPNRYRERSHTAARHEPHHKKAAGESDEAPTQPFDHGPDRSRVRDRGGPKVVRPG